ncbi:isochorismatase family protein [Jonquetella anthropi]|uniref:isochorismatase family protein n=1 Tax=Jonquetella anthropi TaxID=428712 RepID=UPI0023F16C4B|nr:isochorismatase family protein [Jonquetella anthropi]
MTDRLTRSNALTVFIDLQARLLGAIPDGETILKRASDLATVSRTLGVPCVLTEQNPAKLGGTDALLLGEVRESPRVEKKCFSCADSEPFMALLEKSGRKNVILAGVETHICVYMTAVDLKRLGYGVTVVMDCCSCQRLEDGQLAAANLRALGIPTLPLVTVAYRLLQEAGTLEFKALLPLFR